MRKYIVMAALGAIGAGIAYRIPFTRELLFPPA